MVMGAARVAKYVAAFSTGYWQGVEVEWVTTNGQSSAVMRRADTALGGGTVLGIVTIVASEAGIEQLLWMMNPDKIATMLDATR